MKGRRRTLHGLSAAFLAVVLCACANDLHYNAKTGNVANLQQLLERGEPIEKRDPLGNTALIVAAFSNEPETVAYLCRKGADVNAQNNDRATALISAAYYNLLDVARVLVKFDPDKTLKDKYGNTALDYARQYKYAEMISLLEK